MSKDEELALVNVHKFGNLLQSYFFRFFLTSGAHMPRNPKLIRVWTKVVKVKVTLPGILKTENVFFFWSHLGAAKIESKIGLFELAYGSKLFRYFFFLSSSDYTILDNDFYLISTKISEGGSRGRGAGYLSGSQSQ